MSCARPIWGYRSDTVNPATGKRPLQFKVQGSFSGVRVEVPCGQCLGCKLEHSRRWAVRLMHENKMHKQSAFVTLTYDAEHLPAVGSLDPEHLRGFHKRLHNRLLYHRGYGISYYGCGEYGDLNKRPHYHSILFGYQFPDLKKYSENSRGEALYTSELCDDVWGFGKTMLGDVTFESCAYVARYVTKKVHKSVREAGHYLVYDADGVVHERNPEFSHSSRNPAIGKRYFQKYGAEIAQHDTVIVNGREVPSVPYYDKMIDPARLEVLKKARSRKSLWRERQKDRRRVKEVLRLKMMKEKRRFL